MSQQVMSQVGRVDKVVAQPLRWTMASQAAVLAGFGFLPATLPHRLVVVPISFLAGIQIGLFRSIGDLAYMPLATTGNLRRLVEAGYDFFVEKNSSSRRAFTVYAGVIGAFAAGAIAGVFTTHAWGLHAIWVPAGLLAVTLILFVMDEREGTASKWWSNAAPRCASSAAVTAGNSGMVRVWRCTRRKWLRHH